MTDKKKVIARWESRGGKFWTELYDEGEQGYSYRGDGYGGYMGKIDLEIAIARCEQQNSYWPSKAKRVL